MVRTGPKQGLLNLASLTEHTSFQLAMAAFLARAALTAAEGLQSKLLPCLSMTHRGMSVDRSFKEREHAAENLYFSKQEEKALRDLLKKMKSQADHVRLASLCVTCPCTSESAEDLEEAIKFPLSPAKQRARVRPPRPPFQDRFRRSASAVFCRCPHHNVVGRTV